MKVKAQLTEENPMGTDGFEFVEYTAPDPVELARLFETLGFSRVARHRSKDVVLYRQGDINFIINAEPDSFSQQFARDHGPSICAMALRVADARAAYERALSLGARPHHGDIGPMELHIPAIKGIGDSAIYLVDRYGERTIYDVDFVPVEGRSFSQPPPPPAGLSGRAGLLNIDHLTHNVERGHMDEWAGFYERLFGFTEQRFFDIQGKHTGLRSRAMVSPCGKIRIPINESADDKSQIEEYLEAYGGEGIQHLALSTEDVVATVAALRERGVRFLDTPDTYYELLDERLPGHAQDVPRLQEHKVLLDGAPPRLLLQIFTETVIGPIFFELIERRGDQGFGEGNFQALFEAMELDQIRRGVLSA
ncbi:MAG: 4-hydroxyphenylpyruvate dioxygenase [Myxococcales bacterium]|nr:4-hydroxyphenylpyruvate dioxygenase [Myxococcales bacterium]